MSSRQDSNYHLDGVGTHSVRVLHLHWQIHIIQLLVDSTTVSTRSCVQRSVCQCERFTYATLTQNYNCISRRLWSLTHNYSIMSNCRITHSLTKIVSRYWSKFSHVTLATGLASFCQQWFKPRFKPLNLGLNRPGRNKFLPGFLPLWQKQVSATVFEPVFMQNCSYTPLCHLCVIFVLFCLILFGIVQLEFCYPV